MSNMQVIFLFQLMETSGTDILSGSETHAPISPLHLAVSLIIFQCVYIWLCLSHT